MKSRVCALMLFCALCSPAFARASETTVGIALTGTSGTHRESTGMARAPLIPAPIVAVSHRFERWELLGEGLPPIGTIRVANNGLGMRNVSLTYVNAGARYWNRAGTFALGVGETLYNQHTGIHVYQDSFTSIDDVDYSRVVGLRYEAVTRSFRANGDYWEAMLAADPAMHGCFTYTRRFTFVNGRGYQYTTRPVWESAAQVEAGVRFVHRFGSYALSYGVRYLNYTAAFSGRTSGFADANSLVMPYVGVQMTFGR
ncbi:MAG TPA: hypothetical protein VIO32_06660 [Candidatus Baltobacteraceae bacterium]